VIERNPIEREFYGGASDPFSFGQVVGELFSVGKFVVDAATGNVVGAASDAQMLGRVVESGRPDLDNFSRFGSADAVQAFNAGSAAPAVRVRGGFGGVKPRGGLKPKRRPLPPNHPLRRPPVRAMPLGMPVKLRKRPAYLIAAQNILKRPPVRYAHG
jgi:hypothetical protein